MCAQYFSPQNILKEERGGGGGGEANVLSLGLLQEPFSQAKMF